MNQSAGFQPEDFRRSPPMANLITRCLTGLLENPRPSPRRFYARFFRTRNQSDPYRQGYSYLLDESDPTRQAATSCWSPSIMSSGF